MSVDKKINYEMQGDEKPAKNYLGKQKTVTVPVKWKSSPEAPATELAYITKKEKDLLIKKDLHGSLKDGPNTGPSGIMSLDSQGDYTRDRSPGAYDKGPAGTATGSSQQDLRNRAMNEQAMKDLLTGQVDKGQTTRTGPRTRQYSNLPEFITMPDGRTRYVGSAYKSYGQPSFFGNLFSRGAPGYRGIKGLPAFGVPTFETRKRPDGSLEYFTEDEDFGEIKGAAPFGILGILKSIFDSFKKPKDMSEFNKLSLTAPADQKVYIPEGADPSMVIQDPFAKGPLYSRQGKSTYAAPVPASVINEFGQSPEFTTSLMNEFGVKDRGIIDFNEGLQFGSIPGTADQGYVSAFGTADDVTANLLGLPGSADDPYANLLGVPGTPDYYG